VPCSEEVHVKARAALVFGLNREIRYEFSGYRQKAVPTGAQAAALHETAP
jgi:hypothetical protein